MENKVDKKLLANLDKRLKAIDVPSLTMNQQSLVEALYKNLWYNPFPKVKHTERPDTTASAILDGNIVILVDNAPSALLLPTSIFDVLEEADGLLLSACHRHIPKTCTVFYNNSNRAYNPVVAACTAKSRLLPRVFSLCTA